MAHDEPQAAGPTKLVIRNIGLLLSGAMEKPILDADTIVAENGKITGIGRAKDIDSEGATTIDAHGTTVAPGLIDSHFIPSPATGRHGKIRSAGSTAFCTAASPPWFPRARFICPAAPVTSSA